LLLGQSRVEGSSFQTLEPPADKSAAERVGRRLEAASAVEAAW
jgi:hypothetical protein